MVCDNIYKIENLISRTHLLLYLSMCIIKANLLTYDRGTNTHLKLHHVFPLYGDIERGKRIYTL